MKKRNEQFVCTGCGIHVDPAPQTSRNHCPHCFISLHVDGEMPGDRAATCQGVMIPIAYLIKHGKEKVQFLCVSCGKVHTNKLARDDDLGVFEAMKSKRLNRYADHEKVREWKDGSV